MRAALRPTPTVPETSWDALKIFDKRQDPPSVTDCAYFISFSFSYSQRGLSSGGSRMHPKRSFGDSWLPSHLSTSVVRTRSLIKVSNPFLNLLFIIMAADPDCYNVTPDTQSCYPTTDSVIYQNQWTRVVCEFYCSLVRKCTHASLLKGILVIRSSLGTMTMAK